MVRGPVEIVNNKLGPKRGENRLEKAIGNFYRNKLSKK
jgi:hypothetical protein